MTQLEEELPPAIQAAKRFAGMLGYWNIEFDKFYYDKELGCAKVLYNGAIGAVAIMFSNESSEALASAHSSFRNSRPFEFDDENYEAIVVCYMVKTFIRGHEFSVLQ